MFFVYAIHNSVADKIYIGSTDNIERRLNEHNSKGGNHFTSRFEGEWKLIYKEEVEDRRTALIRGKQLKSYQGRKFIKKYIPL